MLKNVGKDGFEILGQTGVHPVTYPDLAGMALGLILPARARAARFGWNRAKTGVPPVTYPDLAGMALGCGQN